MKNVLYSKRFCLIMRIAGTVAFTILLLANIFNINHFVKNKETINANLLVIGINYIVCCICILYVIFPKRLELIGFVCLLYTILISFIEPRNPMNILMIFLSFSCFLVRGFYNNHKRTKIIFSSIFIICMLIVSVIILKRNIFVFLIEKFAYIFICSVIFFLIKYNYCKKYDSNKILNLYHYEKLTKRDAEWLNKILKKVKYETIARNYGMSEGYVRNRICFIYGILGVGDKIGFLNIYGDYSIIYDETD